VETYEYKTINVSLEPSGGMRGPGQGPTVESAANRWAEQGWRTVGVMPARATGYADVILIERVKRKEDD
jgi:hypothetical protein